MKSLARYSLSIFLVLLVAGMGGSGSAFAARALRTVETLDLAAYMGTWHQIAFLPNWFQRRCASHTQAHYTANPEGTVRVLNRCRTRDGTDIEAEGLARRNPAYDQPGVLQVRFAPRFLSFLPFVWGDYWVIALDETHGAVLVGTPSRRYLWVLARDPVLDDAVYARLVGIAQREGFDVAALVRQ